MAVAVTDPRRCADCHDWKPLTAFYVKTWNYGKPRYDSSCKICRNARTREFQTRPENVVRVAEYKRRWHQRGGGCAIREKAYAKFNATIAAYDLQFQSQHNCCGICLRHVAEGEQRFAFDHDHATGSARGILCPSCNGALGCLRDRQDLLLAALRYLEYWERQQALMMGTNGV